MLALSLSGVTVGSECAWFDGERDGKVGADVNADLDADADADVEAH